MKRTRIVNKKRALAKREPDDKALAPIAKSFAAMIEGKAHAMGLPLKVDQEYSLPFVNRKFVLWMKFINKKDGTVSWVPYVEHKGMVDVLMQKGYESLNCQMLEPLRCIEAGCYGAGPNDYMQRSACTIQLRSPKKGVPGRWARLEGDACRHNTTSMIAGSADKRANGMRRLSETRGMDRVISRLCNVGAMSLLELPEIEKDTVARRGDRMAPFMSAGELHKIIEGDFRVAESGVMPTSSKPMDERSRAEAAQNATENEPQRSPEGLEANRAIHRLLSDHGLGGELTGAAHSWICRMAHKAFKRDVIGVRKLTDDELIHVKDYMTTLQPEAWSQILAWCKQQ